MAIDRWLFWKPAIVQFGNGSYGIRRFFLFHFVYKDFTLRNEAILADSLKTYCSKSDEWFKRGDCGKDDLDYVIEIFQIITLRESNKKAKKPKILFICNTASKPPKEEKE